MTFYKSRFCAVYFVVFHFWPKNFTLTKTINKQQQSANRISHYENAIHI